MVNRCVRAVVFSKEGRAACERPRRECTPKGSDVVMGGDAEMNRWGLWWWLRAGLILVVAAGLAIDAFVHLDLASSYDGVKSSVLTQGDLFRVEAALAIIAALALVVRPRRWTALIAFLVSAGGFAAVLVYQYVDVGAIGPLPNMYDPVVYAEKTLSVWAEGIAAVAALVLLTLMHLRIRGDRTASGAAARTSASRPA
jgi:hypothetical protein